MDLNLSLSSIVEHLILLSIAYVLALPVAWDRENRARSAGLRTFPLVALASCGYMLVGVHSMSSAGELSRIMQGIIGGIGFIGGGAILKSKGSVKGTATAASLWATGAIGVAVAFKNIEIALTISLITFLTLTCLQHFKDEVDDKPSSA